MARIVFLCALFGMLAVLTGCTESGKVVQGKVVAFDAQERWVTIASEGAVPSMVDTPPTATYRLPADAKDVGPLPQIGDVVRIYYKQDGQALRFMNVTRTDIYKK